MGGFNHTASCFVHLGFNWATALSISRHYTIKLYGITEGLYNFSYAQIANRVVADPVTQNDEAWDNCMRILGINSSLRTAVLDPAYADIRHTASCKTWLLRALEARFHHLRELCGNDQQQQPAPPTAPAQTGLRDHQLLYHAAPAHLISTLYSPRTASLALNNSIPPTTRSVHFHTGDYDHNRDSNRSQACMYFTPQRTLAQRHARFLQRLGPGTRVYVLHVAVPDTTLAQLTTADLDDDVGAWKRLACLSKRGEAPEPTGSKKRRRPNDDGEEAEDDEDFCERVWDKDILCGPVVSARRFDLRSLAMDWRGLEDEEDVVWVEESSGGRFVRATQTVFQTARARGLVEEACRGKVWAEEATGNS